MSRLKEVKYDKMKSNELCDPIVFVVDMVVGFCEEGALADSQIMSIVPNQIRMMETLMCRNMFVCDSHPPVTREFQAYPAHCVIGTREAEVIHELEPYIRKIIHKNSTNTFMAPEFQEFLDSDLKNYKDIIIVGCCTDLCIMQFALSMQAYLNEHNLVEHRIIVPCDCVETYHIDGIHDAYFWNDVALQNMAANGIQVVSEIEG